MQDLIIKLIFAYVIAYLTSRTLLIHDESNVTENYNKTYLALLVASAAGISEQASKIKDEYSTINIILFVFFIVSFGVVVSVYKRQHGINNRQALLSMMENNSIAIGSAEVTKKKTDNNRIKKLLDERINVREKEILQIKEILAI